jgi:glycosyltransferase involved in cell wall biosynthesis
MKGPGTTAAKPRVTILTGIFPPDIGGPATSVPGLVRVLDAKGWDATVVTLADDLAADDSDPCRVVRVPRARRWPLRAGAVARAVTRSRPDVVLANGLHLESAVISGAPVVQKIVGDWAWERSRNAGTTSLDIGDFQSVALPAKLRALRALRSAVTRRARAVIVPSRYLAGLCAGWKVPPERIHVIPNAAPPVTANAHERLNGRSSRGPLALFVGRLVSWKHVDDILRVMPSMPEMRLEVIGIGDELPALEQLSRDLRVEDRVRFLGRQDREAVIDRMASASFLVLPSSYEGMPHVVLEAFACGLPVVASDAGGTPEIVRHGETGLVYPCRDLGGLETALRNVMNAERAEAIARAGLRAASELTAAESAGRTERVLAGLLDRAGTPR